MAAQIAGGKLPVKEIGKGNTMAKNKYRVRYAGADTLVYADKAAHVSDGISFWVKGDGVLNDLVAHFPHGAYFTLVEDGDPRPAPVEGVDYYTVEDLTRALKDLNFSNTDNVVSKLRQRLSVRSDGRYTLGELKTAIKQTEHISGPYYAERLDAAALQARKNRVWDAHTC